MYACVDRTSCVIVSSSMAMMWMRVCICVMCMSIFVSPSPFTNHNQLVTVHRPASFMVEKMSREPPEAAQPNVRDRARNIRHFVE